jgi:ATP-dependent DNA helicase PIF1
VVRGFQRNVIDAEIVLGQHAGKRIFLPRIPLCPSDDEMFPFQFKRKQFPVRLSFAMTVNKAQGQTIPNAGIYLPEPVFSHGQLYVALSRSTARKNVKILVITDVDNKKTNFDESKKEEASCQYLHEEHSLEGDPYILGEILCACTFSNHYAIF